jgi:hypothetical protein
VATMARPTSSSVADSTLKCLRGNHQIRTRKKVPPFPHRRVTGVEQEHTGHSCGADTVWGTVYVQRDDELLEKAVKHDRCRRCQTAIAEVPRQIGVSYRPRARCIPPRQHRPSWAKFTGPPSRPRRDD